MLDAFSITWIPIVATNQINRGGAVILVQLENEHPKGWGTVTPNAYFRFLKDKCVSTRPSRYPIFFSGLHHASDPATDWSASSSNCGPG